MDHYTSPAGIRAFLEDAERRESDHKTLAARHRLLGNRWLAEYEDREALHYHRLAGKYRDILTHLQEVA